MFSRLPSYRTLCHIMPSHITPPEAFHCEYQSINACVRVCACASYSKQDVMFTCVLSEEFSSIAGVGYLQIPEASANMHGVSTRTLHSSHTGSLFSFFFFSSSTARQLVCNSFLSRTRMLLYFWSPRCFPFLREMFTVNSCLILL